MTDDELIVKLAELRAARTGDDYPVPATEQAVRQTELGLGFQLPPILRRCYLEIANGGFGPVVFSLNGLTDHYRQSLAERPEAGCIPWPEGLLEICDRGCAIKSAVYCLVDGCPVYRVDPSYEYDEIRDAIPEDRRDERLARVGGSTWIEATSMVEWLTRFAEGQDSFGPGYGGPR